MTDDPTRLDITDASAALRTGAVTPTALLNGYLDRIARYDGRLNAFIALLDERARRAAAAADRRLAAGSLLSPIDGIPIALKDNIDIAGVNTSNGMARNAIAAESAPLVVRLEAAGAIVVGKLNMHEGALGGTTNNPHHGATHNPWRRGHTPGGSSGGSGAAVAARLVAGAVGTDTLGSVRLPAAYCGACGLKPTAGLISTRGIAPLSYALDNAGPLARSVRDLALLTAAMAGVDAFSPGSVAAPEGWTAGDGAPASLSEVRVAIPDFVDEVETAPAVRDGFAAAVDCLIDLGAKVATAKVEGYAPTRMRRHGFLISEVEGAHALSAELDSTPASFSPDFRRMLEYGRGVPVQRYLQAQRETAEAGVRLRRLFERFDLVATPTAPQLAFAFDAVPPANQADFTAIANYAGCPAISLPCAISADGLPVGLQLMARPFAEAVLLGAAAAIEQALALDLEPSGYS